MLRYLIEDSKPDLQGKSDKYVLADPKMQKKYEKSRLNKDIWGNNPFHYLFDINV